MNVDFNVFITTILKFVVDRYNFWLTVYLLTMGIYWGSFSILFVHDGFSAYLCIPEICFTVNFTFYITLYRIQYLLYDHLFAYRTGLHNHTLIHLYFYMKKNYSKTDNDFFI